MTQSNTCHICGGTYVPVRERWKCEYCGAFAPISINNEISTLLTIANQSLRNSDFDGAYDEFNDIATRNPSVSDAFWGLACSEYGIKLEDDYNGKKVPTCYNASYESLYENENFKKALSLADLEQKEYYNSIAKVIEATRKEWIEKASKEKPYDIFLSYKSTENGERTDDENDVYDLYNYLTSKGYRVFFAKVSLKDKAGERYEPYIFNALNTSKVMIVYGSKMEYFNATWVRNEWKRYLKRVSNKEKQSDSLVVVYKGLNPGRLPKPLDKIQNIDRNTLDFSNVLLSKIESIISRSDKKTLKVTKTEIKEVKAKDKIEIETIKKRSLGNREIEFDKKEANISVKTRKIGTYEVNKVTPDDENKLKIASVYLKQNTPRDFKSALKSYQEILANDDKNPTAILGKALASNQSTDLNMLISKFNTFNSFESLSDVIEYGRKEDVDKILNAISSECTSTIGKNGARVRTIFLSIMSYDSPIIKALYKDLITNSLKYIIDEKSPYLECIDNALDYLYVDKETYVSFMRLTLETIAKLKITRLTEKYLNKYKKTIGEDEITVGIALVIKYKTGTIKGALKEIARCNALNDIEEALNSVDIKDAESLLEIVSLTIKDAIEKKDYKVALILLNFVLGIDYRGREALIAGTFNALNTKPSKEAVDVFETLLKTFEESQFKEYIKANLEFAKGLLNNSEFKTAEFYLDRYLEYDPYNKEAIILKWSSNILITDPSKIDEHLDSTTDFSSFERLLSLEKGEGVTKRVNSTCESYCKIIKNRLKDPESINDKLFDTFEKFLSYYPEESNLDMAKLMVKLSNELLSSRFFKYAEKYLAMASSYETENSDIYWLLLKTKLKCATDEELITQHVPITSLLEYDNAVNATYDSPETLEKYISIRNKQEDWLKGKKDERKKKVSKIVKIGVLIIVAAGVVSFIIAWIAQSYHDSVVRIRESFIALANDGEYSMVKDRYNHLSFEYKKSKTLKMIANMCSLIPRLESGELSYFDETKEYYEVDDNGCIIKISIKCNYENSDSEGYMKVGTYPTISFVDYYSGTIEVKYDVHYEKRPYYSDDKAVIIGSYLYFGSYPQMKETRSDVLSHLNSMVEDNLPHEQELNGWTYCGQNDFTYNLYDMYYIDIDDDLDGSYDYRGMYFTEYKIEEQLTNGYVKNKVHWFKYEPIRWLIVDIEDGKAMIASQMLLDTKEYYKPFKDTHAGYESNYAESYIRYWLNEEFYKITFNDTEKDVIETTLVDNSKEALGCSEEYACQNTNDKLFILSPKENGLVRDIYDHIAAPFSTDYTLANGMHVYKDTGYGYSWVRRPAGNDSVKRAWASDSSNSGSGAVAARYVGVRVACWIKL